VASEWDDTAWGGTAILPSNGRHPDSAIVKAATGPGVAMISYHDPISVLARTPQDLMRRAQAAYHANPWIRTAETVVTRKVVGLPWHLEDGEDEEYGENAPEPVRLARALLEKPQQALPLEQRQMTLQTRRAFTSLTSRHLGLCGLTYWYLDQRDALYGIPLALLYVNPVRVWPAANDMGQVTGWVLDPRSSDGSGGLPLAVDELLPFYLDPPDSGVIAHGLYEAAALKAQITSLADQHTAYVLATGGRLAGILGPKEGVIPDEEYQQLVREFRNVTEAPDAAKRLTIVKGPVDFLTTAAGPKDLDLVSLATMNRDDILSVWGVPPSQAGIPAPAGLNSGDTKKYDEAVLMQGAVHDRVLAYRETVQFGLLDRFPVPIEYEIEEPEFDDKTPAFENAARAVAQPLRNKERRELLGIEPFGDDRDEEVWLPATSVLAYGPAVPVKATREQREFLGLRRSIETRWLPRVRSSVADLLADQRREVASKVRSASPDTIARQRKNPQHWFTLAKEAERLEAVLRPHETAIAETVAERAASLLKPAKAEPFTESVVAAVSKSVGSRVKEISRTTQEAIADAVLAGYDAGLSPAQIAETIEGLPAFDAARAELVARTETMFAYNSAALSSFQEFGVGQVEAIDGDEDEVCAARNGQTYPVDEAFGIEDHPNGTLDWIPILEPVKAAVVERPPEAPAAVVPPATAVVRFEVPDREPNPAPIVNVAAPEPSIVTMPSPVVNVPAPIVNVDMAPVAAMLAELKEIIRKPVTKNVERDEAGRILRVVET